MKTDRIWEILSVLFSHNRMCLYIFIGCVYIFSMYYIRVPGHQALQDFVGWGLTVTGKMTQHKQEVFIGLHAIAFDCLHQLVHSGAGLSTPDAIAEQPILSAQHKGTDCVLFQIIGDRNLRSIQKCCKLFLLVQRIAHRLIQFAPFL